MSVNSKYEAKVVSRFVKISPNKLRRIAYCIKNKSVDESLLILKFLPHKGCKIFITLINAGYKNLCKGSELDIKSIFIKDIKIDDGPFFKRFQPHAQGRSFPIKKRTSHITVRVITYLDAV